MAFLLFFELSFGREAAGLSFALMFFLVELSLLKKLLELEDVPLLGVDTGVGVEFLSLLNNFIFVVWGNGSQKSGCFEDKAIL